LRGVLSAALGDGERVGEDGGVGPEGEFAEGGFAGEEVEDAACDYLLGLGEGHAGSGGEGGGLDFVLIIGESGGGHGWGGAEGAGGGG